MLVAFIRADWLKVAYADLSRNSHNPGTSRHSRCNRSCFARRGTSEETESVGDCGQAGTQSFIGVIGPSIELVVNDEAG